MDVRSDAERGMRSTDLQPSSAAGIERHAARTRVAFDTPHSALRAGHSIVLHIDELVLHGFSAADRHIIAAGVERELGRLISQQRLTAPPASSAHFDELDGGSFRLARASRAAATGSEIANAVFSATCLAMSPTEPRAAVPLSSSTGAVPR